MNKKQNAIFYARSVTWTLIFLVLSTVVAPGAYVTSTGLDLRSKAPSSAADTQTPLAGTDRDEMKKTLPQASEQPSLPNSTQALPNLTPFQRNGWSDKIVVSTLSGTNTDSPFLTTTDTLYIDLAVINNGGATISSTFFTALFVDGVERTSFIADPPFNVSTIGFVEDYSIGSLGAGPHTIRIVADSHNNVVENNEFDNEYTKFITVSLPALPNLTPYRPNGWSDRIVVSNAPGSNQDSVLLRTTDSLYLDWAVVKSGIGASMVTAYLTIFIDGVERTSWFVQPPWNANTYTFVEDYPIGSLSPGTHTIRIVADSRNSVVESSEFDNEYSRLVNISSPELLPNLTPYQPAGWSDRIVVSEVTGTHADGSGLKTTDSLYVDWALINNGAAAISSRFSVRLLVDGVEKGQWFAEPPFNINVVGTIEDYPIGSLGSGNHTIKIVADTQNSVTESSELDNEYVRTVSVSAQSCNTLTVNISPSEGGTVSRSSQASCSAMPASIDEIASVSQPASPTSSNVMSLARFSPLDVVEQAFRRLIAEAETAGSVRVIVGVQAPFRSEGFLDGLVERKDQRDRIARAQVDLLGQMSAFNVQAIKRFETIPFISMQIDAVGLRFLEGSPNVTSIEEDRKLQPALIESTSLIGAPAAWASGYTGAGQAIAILDTGVDKSHPFLAGKVISEACYSTSDGVSTTSVCPGGLPESTSVGSGINCLVGGCNHGTHVAGIAAGRGTGFSGVAKDANVISIQVFSKENSQFFCGQEPAPCTTAFTSDVLRGIERVAALAGTFDIASVNLSLGGGKFTSNCDSRLPSLKTAIDNLRSVGIATVVASGNESFTDALSMPACISSAIGVGSTGDGSEGTVRDKVSSFSNSASFLNLLAPGESIFSSVPGGGFSSFQGTSMATPHVAGAVAVLKSKVRSATVEQILTALTSSGVPINDSRNGIVTPRIQVDAAANALISADGSGPGQYRAGGLVSLSANPSAGFTFVKWQRDGADFSTSPNVNVAMNANYLMTAIFSRGPVVSTVIQTSPKILRIDGSNFGQAPRVILNGVDRSDFITVTSPTSITLKGKQKKLGLRTGENRIQVIGDGGAASNMFVLTL